MKTNLNIQTMLTMGNLRKNLSELELKNSRDIYIIEQLLAIAENFLITAIPLILSEAITYVMMLQQLKQVQLSRYTRNSECARGFNLLQ